MRRWHYLVLGAMAACSFFSVVLVVYALTRRPAAVPIQVTVLNDGLPAQHEVCPGDIYTATSRIAIVEPTILEIDQSVLAADGFGSIPGTQVQHLPRPHPNAGAFVQRLAWRVPRLAPGDYVKVTSIQTHHADSTPYFTTVKFHVRSDCPL